MRPVRASSSRGGRSPRFRVPIAIGLALLFTLFLSASGIARLFTEYLWFDALGRSSVWQTLFSTQIALAAFFTTVFFALLWTNLYVADRMAPPLRLEGPEDDLIERYHQLVGPHAGKLRIGIALFFAGFAGLQTGQQWETWVLFRNGGDVGFDDPVFGRDAGFYMFRLPFWTFLIDWFFAALVFCLILVTIAHYLNGGIRAATAGQRMTPGVKLHLSVLLATLAVLRAGAYWFDRFELLTGTRSLYTGAFATDVEIQLPALNLLILVSLFGAGLIIYNIRRKGFGLPLAAVGIWLLVHIVVGSIFPSLYQRLRVEPQLSSQEAPFIARNIEATRFAYGLGESSLTREDYAYESGITAEEVEANGDVFDRVQILDPTLVDETITKDEAQRKEYNFSIPLDVGRYDIDGEVEPVVLSARLLDLGQADSGWENQHLAYTHGYAAVIASASQTRRQRSGLPDAGHQSRSGSTTSLGVSLDRPQVYFSDGLGGFAVVGARRDEIDFPGGNGAANATTRYEGEGGVPMGSVLRRLAFSLRFQDLSTLISGELTSESKVIFNRDVTERARTLAPFLDYDADPYPIVAEGRIQWIVDAYTTSNEFPYSQGNRVRSLVPGADLASNFNYVRNSVKVVVDAYDGDVSFYIVDDQDPVVAAYAKAFPNIFTPVSEAPAEISQHFRYPTDLFKVQSEMYTTYHVDDPRQFLQDDKSWAVALEPLRFAESSTTRVDQLMPPQYRLTRLPGENEPEYVIQRPFVPSSGSDSESSRPELTAVFVGRSEGENAGKLVVYDLPTNVVSDPGLIDTDIRQDEAVFDFTKPLDSTPGGAVANWGEMQLVMVADTIVYVRPLYVAGDGGSRVPVLTQVIAVSGERIGMAPTLDAALAKVVTDPDNVEGVDTDGMAPTTPTTPTTPPTPTTPTTPTTPSIPAGDLEGRSAAELLGMVEEFLDTANRLQDTDPEQASALRAQAQQALDQLALILGVEPSPVIETGEA